MLKFVFRRVLSAALLVLFVSMVSFGLLFAAGDPATALVGQSGSAADASGCAWHSELANYFKGRKRHMPLYAQGPLLQYTGTCGPIPPLNPSGCGVKHRQRCLT